MPLTNTSKSPIQLIHQFLINSYPLDPTDNFEYRLMPHKDNVWFNLYSGNFDYCIYAESVNDNITDSVNNGALELHVSDVSINICTRVIPDPNEDDPVLWHLRSFYEKLIRKNGFALETDGINVMTLTSSIELQDVPLESHQINLFIVKIFIRVTYELQN